MYDVANGVVNFYDTITSTKKSKTKTMMAV
jgi:hypothetical protein